MFHGFMKNAAMALLVIINCLVTIPRSTIADEKNTNKSSSIQKKKAKIVESLVVLWYDSDFTRISTLGWTQDSIARKLLKEQNIDFKENDISAQKVTLSRQWTVEDTAKSIRIFFKNDAESVAQSVAQGRAILQRT